MRSTLVPAFEDTPDAVLFWDSTLVLALGEYLKPNELQEYTCSSKASGIKAQLLTLTI